VRRLGLFFTLCVAVPVLAQEVERLPLVGVLRINSVANNEPTATLLRDELAALGDVDGKNIRLDSGWPRVTLDGFRNWRRRWSERTRLS
jgi:hypothetical protein